MSQGDWLPRFLRSQAVEMAKINNASLLWHLKGCDKIRPFWCMIYFEILKAELEENSDPRIARFCFGLFFFQKKPQKVQITVLQNLSLV